MTEKETKGGIAIVEEGSSRYREEVAMARDFEEPLIIIIKEGRSYQPYFSMKPTGQELSQEGVQEMNSLLNEFREKVWEKVGTQRKKSVESYVNRVEGYIKGLNREEARTIAHILYVEVLSEWERFSERPTSIEKFP